MCIQMMEHQCPSKRRIIPHSFYYICFSVWLVLWEDTTSIWWTLARVSLLMRTCSPIFEVNGSTMTLMSVMLHNTHRRAQQAYSVRANSVIEYGSNHSDFVQRCEPEFRLETKIVYVPHFIADGNFSFVELYSRLLFVYRTMPMHRPGNRKNPATQIARLKLIDIEFKN